MGIVTISWPVSNPCPWRINYPCLDAPSPLMRHPAYIYMYGILYISSVRIISPPLVQSWCEVDRHPWAYNTYYTVLLVATNTIFCYTYSVPRGIFHFWIFCSVSTTQYTLWMCTTRSLWATRRVAYEDDQQLLLYTMMIMASHQVILKWHKIAVTEGVSQ